MNFHSINSHTGDLIWALNAITKWEGQHVLRCNPSYIPQLRELVEGTNVTIEDCSNIPAGSNDIWIASGLFERVGVRYDDPVDILGFVQKYFNALGRDLNLGEPFKTREDMICQFPSIHCTRIGDFSTKDNFTGILAINCDPKSGQCPRYSSSEMDLLIERLQEYGHSVLAVEKADLSLVQIGALSINAKLIVGCATGPWWPTVNRWNKDVQRICMLSPMRLDYGSVPIVHAADAREVATIMEGMGYL